MTEDVSQFIKKKPESFIFYDADGNVQAKVEGSCAYIQASRREAYFVRFYRNRLFDPQGIDARKINSVYSQHKKVNKKVFDLYLKYLKTKKTGDLAVANRSLIDV